MYTLAKDFFPDNKKLDLKLHKLRGDMQQRKPEKRQNEPIAETLVLGPNNNRQSVYSDCGTDKTPLVGPRPSKSNTLPKQKDSGVQAAQADAQPFTKTSTLDTVIEIPPAKQDNGNCETEVHGENHSDRGFHYKAKTKKGSRSKSVHDQVQTPRTKQLLEIVNARDRSQISLLRGVGAKKAEAIVKALCGADEDETNENVVKSLEELGRLRGVGPKTVENMRMGLQTV